MTYECAKSGDRFDTKKFLEETVRKADHTTRDVMFIAHAGKGNPKQLRELAEAYKHCAERLNYVAEGLIVKANMEKEASDG